jgi:nucleotide-binding universal stress UspA family protein
MHRFRKILVPVQGDLARQPVLGQAARLARQSGAAIRLVAVVEELPWYARLVHPQADELQAALVRESGRGLDELADRLRRDGLDVSTGALRGRRHLELVREVQRGGHDLLLKEAEPNEGVPFGSTDMHLLRTCPCPLWLFRPEHADRDPERILAPVDPSPSADEADLLHLKAELAPKDRSLDAKILDFAGSLAGDAGAELHVVHAWSAPGEDLLRGETMLSGEEIGRYVEDAEAEARKALDRLLARTPEPSGGRVAHLVKGDPADVIVETAKSRKIDLIVMGTVARTGIPGLLIGNTAESVLQRVACSVFAIKPDGFVSPAVPTEAAPRNA